MNIQDKYGSSVILPKSATCLRSGKNPDNMDKCPIYNFDDDGDICVPELCDEYRTRADYIYKYKDKE